MFDQDLVQRFQALPTPFFYYDIDLLQKTLNSIKEHGLSKGYHVHYALKANFNDTILETIKAAGLGADCVSGNEVKKAIEIGFSADKVVFAGVGKSDEEINLALSEDILCFNVESAQELAVINQFAGNMNKKANVALRINPNVNADTHHYITTGLEENKFGINLWELDEVMGAIKQYNNIQLSGIHFHIGSQITNLSAFRSLCEKTNEIQDFIEGHGVVLKHINVGGGLGINYEDPNGEPISDFESYFDIFNKNLSLRKGQELHFELGRAVVAQCGSLISKVLFIKKGIQTNFAIIDAGMTELIRPALYQAKHHIESLTSKAASTALYDVVGPICESSDCFRKGFELPELQRGDLLAIRSAGAYGEVMTSFYNLRDKAKAYYSTDLREMVSLQK